MGQGHKTKRGSFRLKKGKVEKLMIDNESRGA
jgi:hypothetical protein